MEADSNSDSVGSIGLASPADGLFLNAIDTQVQVLSAKSAEGIYIREVDGLQVAATGDISAEQVRFNSSSTTVIHATLSDLETTTNGNIVLVSERGNLVVVDGDNDMNGVVANGQGNILLLTSDLVGDDIVLDANVVSGTGQITASAGRDVVISATISSGRRGSTPDIYLRAFSGFIDEGPIAGDQAKIIGGSLQISAAKYAHLHDTTVESLTATVGANGQLQAWQTVNRRVSERGDDFLLEATWTRSRQLRSTQWRANSDRCVSGSEPIQSCGSTR